MSWNVGIQSFVRLITGRKNRFAQLCSLQTFRKSVKTEEYIWGRDGVASQFVIIIALCNICRNL